MGNLIIKQPLVYDVYHLLSKVTANFDFHDILNSIKISAKDGHIKFVAFGGLASVQVEINGETTDSIEAIVESRVFLNTIFGANEDVHITDNGKELLIKVHRRKVVLSKKNPFSFPDFPTINNITCSPLTDSYEFKQSLLMAAEYLDTNASNYLGGILITDTYIISTNRKKAIITKHKEDLKISQCILPKSSISMLTPLENYNIQISTDISNTLLLNVDEPNIKVQMLLKLVDDQYPIEEVLDLVNKLVKQEGIKFELPSIAIFEATRKILIAANTSDLPVCIDIKNDKTTISYSQATYNFTEDIDLENEGEATLKVPLDILKTINKSKEPTLKSKYLKDNKILLTKNNKSICLYMLL